MIEGLSRRFPSLFIAIRNLRRSKARSVLATIAVVIGVVAIASLGMFGASLQFAFEQELGDVDNQLIVAPDPEEGIVGLHEQDVQDIHRVADDAEVVPVTRSQLPVTRDNETRVVMTIGADQPRKVYTADRGRIPEPFRDGALVGSDLADALSIEPGNTLTINGSSYRVRALLETHDGFHPLSPEHAVVIPTAETPEDVYSEILVTASSGTAADRTAVELRQELNDPRDRVVVVELADVSAAIGSIFDTLNAFLLGIGAISLVVASVCILTVQLMSSIERRAEIGVLRAIGFRKRSVLRIMLAEACILGIVGGVVGLLISAILGFLINLIVVGDPLAALRPANLAYLALAFFVAVLTVLTSGFYPAWRAANERPVDAIGN